MICAVLNPEPDGIALTVLKDDALLIDARTEMYGREAAALPDFIITALAENALTLDDVDQWSVGSGPGSFTALRMVAALVSGWCFGKKDVVCRGVPGAVALACGAPQSDRIGALYDGRNHELLYFGLKRENGAAVPTGETHVLNAGEAESFFAGRKNEVFVCHTHDLEAVKAILPENVGVVPVAKADTAALARNTSIAFDNDLTKLVYIRPAVYTHLN